MINSLAMELFSSFVAICIVIALYIFTLGKSGLFNSEGINWKGIIMVLQLVGIVAILYAVLIGTSGGPIGIWVRNAVYELFSVSIDVNAG